MNTFEDSEKDRAKRCFPEFYFEKLGFCNEIIH